MTDPPAARSWVSSRPLALPVVLGAFRHGGGDPTYRVGPDAAVTRAAQTPDGPVTLTLRCHPRLGRVEATAWGPGGPWALEHAPALVGEDDDPGGFVAHHDRVAQLARRFPGWRVPRSGLVLDALVPAIVEQKVTGAEAFAGYRRLVRRYGEPAPGPAGRHGLMVAPTAGGWQRIPSWEWLRAPVDPARSGTVLRACGVAGRLQQAADLDLPAAYRRLRAVPGVGVWTAAEVAQRALGDADAVSFGDYHVARDVGWALVGQPLDDAGLAEVLAPYAGHRYRVQRLVELGGVGMPRRGPRMPPRTHLPR
ncbi:MAG: DNA-3-methyladenine glycosylase 2 family protein [Dermatophilaceae bacterium]